MHPRVPLLLFTLVILLPLAGCASAGSIEMRPANDTELANYASRTLPTEDNPETNERRELVRGAVENGSATANGTAPPVDPDGLPFAVHESESLVSQSEISISDDVDGAYYDLSAEQVDSHTETVVDLAVDYNGSTEGEAVAYENLSAADQRLVDAVLPPTDGRRSEGYDFGAGARYTDAEAEASVLLDGDYDAVAYEGERYPIRVEDRTVTVHRYRYTATEVAPNASAYGATLREEHLFVLSRLSDAERDVVSQAVDGGYYAESSGDDVFQSVLERFLSHDAVEGGATDDYAGSWVVRYDGAVYWAELRYEGMDVEESG